MAVIVYRELNPDMPDHIASWLEDRGQLVWVLDKKGKEHAIVENDIPRPAEITEAIVGGTEAYGPGLTIGFGVYDDEGNRIGMYSSVDRAERAAREAQVTTVDSDIDFEWDSVDATS